MAMIQGDRCTDKDGKSDAETINWGSFTLLSMILITQSGDGKDPIENGAFKYEEISGYAGIPGQ
jgi:hypothetical protein